MILDILLVGFCLMGLINGYRRGVGLELIKLGGAVGGGVAAVFLVPWLGGYLSGSTDMNYIGAHVWAFVAAGVLILLLTDLPARIVGRLRPSAPDRASRAVGAGFGLLRNLMIAALLAGLIQYYPNLWSGLDSTAFASTYDATMEPAVKSGLGEDHLLFSGRELLENPEMVDRVAESPEIQGLVMDPKVRELIEDPEIRRAAREGNYAKLANDPRVNALLADPEFRAQFQRALRRAIDRAQRESEGSFR